MNKYKGMTCLEINRFFKSMERKTQNGITLLHTREGAAGIEKPFVIFLAPDGIESPCTEIARFLSIYEVMDYVKEYLKAKPKTGYFHV